MIMKKLRSKLPRRKRTQISPIHTESSNSVLLNNKLPQFSAVQADSSSSSCFPGEISSLSSLSTWIPVESSKKPRSTTTRQKRNYEVAFPPDVISGDVSRPITRSYLKQIEVSKKGNEVTTGIELSESSCVESAIGAQQIEVSEASCLQPKHDQIQTSVNEVSTISVLQSKRSDEQSLEEFSVDQQPKKLKVDDVDVDVDLACSENLSFEDDSEHNTTLYELDSDFFTKSSSLEFSDFSPSMLDELTQESDSDDSDSPPPIYFPYYVEYQKQFSKLNSSIDLKASAQVHEEFQDQFTLTRFENEEYEDSYMKFRGRERKLVLHDFGEEYSSTSPIGDLVLQQRLLMVNWIVEQAEVQKLQSETMFLGVSLMDRFLSRGYFTQKRKLQILGIACLTLATRIEENQPYNCVRRSAFYIGKSVYSRSEVIGMEWLVQEVLNFQCYLPTIYNFLWFYLKAAKANAEVEKRTKYLAVLSLLDHERLVYWPSTVAAGLVILASLAANQDPSCQWVMETHVRTKDDDLPECIQSLEWLVKYVC